MLGDDLIEVRITAPTIEVAQRLAELLVTERLAACAQVLPGLTSTYRWQGRVERAVEHLILVKTTGRRFRAVRERVRAEHPYDVPEVLAVPIVHDSSPYAAWVRDAVRDR